jgi:hypothetical protein
MSDSMVDLEREIEQSRARLDLTIDRLQDKLTVSGVVDDTLGAVRKSSYAPVYDNVLATLRRNPVPVMLVAAGMAMIFYRMTTPPRPRPARVKVAVIETEEPLAPDYATAGLITDPAAPLSSRPPALEPLGPDLDSPSRRY